MTSSLIPDVDLVPSVASRVVTIDVTDMQEGAPAEGHIDFVLPVDLHVPADDKIIRAGSVRVTLADGKGEVRLPTYDPDARMVDGSDDWVILVKKSWTGKSCGHGRGCGCGGAYAIRVPVGTSSISLADLPAVRALTPREQMYAITGASVSTTTGAQWGASVNLNGGVLDFAFTVPPGGTAWDKTDGGLSGSTDLSQLSAGLYRVNSGADAEALGLPFHDVSTLEVKRALGGTSLAAIIEQTGFRDSSVGPGKAVAWRGSSGALGPWAVLNSNGWDKTDEGLTSATDLGQLSAGLYRVSNVQVAEALGLPFHDVSTVEVKPALGGTSLAAIIEQTGYRDSSVGPGKAVAWRGSSGSLGPWAVLNSDESETGLAITGWGSSSMHLGAPYLEDIAGHRGAVWVNGAKGGDLAQHTAAKLGAIPALLTFPGGEIPASGQSSVSISNVPAGPFGTFIVGSVEGVQGTLTINSSGASFTRAAPGNPVAVPGDAPFTPTLGAKYRNAPAMIWTGKNNFSATEDGKEVEVIEAVAACVNYLQPLQRKLVLVLGHWMNTGVAAGDKRRAQMEAVHDDHRTRYGQSFIDVGAFLFSPEVWGATGITPTSEDLAQQAAENLPPSLAADAAHLNDAAYGAVMKMIGDALDAVSRGGTDWSAAITALHAAAT